MDREARLKRLYGMDKEAGLGETLSGAWDAFSDWSHTPAGLATWGALKGSVFGWLLTRKLKGVAAGGAVGAAGMYGLGKLLESGRQSALEDLERHMPLILRRAGFPLTPEQEAAAKQLLQTSREDN